MRPSVNAVWPFDVIWPIQPSVNLGEAGKPWGDTSLSCFVIQPTRPRERNEFVYSSVETAVREVNELINGDSVPDAGLNFQADRSETPGVIQREIWESIRDAELVVADVSAYNRNVMYELGVAAATKGSERVIILRERGSRSSAPFDLSPIRYFEYKRSIRGQADLIRQLRRWLLDGLTRAMLERSSDSFRRQVDGTDDLSTSLEADFSDSADYRYIVSPGDCHRLPTAQGLQFGRIGSIYKSWLAVTTQRRADCSVSAEMRIDRPLGATVGDCWVGIGVRKSSPLANYGYLLYVRGDGRVQLTTPLVAPEQRGGRLWDYGDRHVVAGESSLCPGGDCRCGPVFDAMQGNRSNWYELRLDVRGAELRFEVLDSSSGVRAGPIVVGLRGEFANLSAGWTMAQCWNCLAAIKSLRLDST